jgi:hypothetical protein
MFTFINQNGTHTDNIILNLIGYKTILIDGKSGT